MSHGKVTVWKMTEEERLAYIAKHPIVPTAQPKEAKFSTDGIDFKETNERKKEALKKKGKKIDAVDKEKLHKMFMDGKRLDDIAEALNINVSTLNSYIKEQRKIEPEKWPYRAPKK